tara:strand:+ start:16865 stop:17548 length:684 start_codon:yes stop_codon:yes gene_type:complete
VTNNYFLRRLRYTFDFNDTKMLELWALADKQVTREQVTAWLKQDDDPDFVNCSDRMLAIFLNGLINDLRGKKDGPQMAPESRLNNNIILRKLKIALNLRDEDICDIINSGGIVISKSELGAFFRKVGHHNYRELQDQILRKFMQGLQAKHRAPNQQTKKLIKMGSTKHDFKKTPQVSTTQIKTTPQAKTKQPAVKSPPQELSPNPEIPTEENASQAVNSHIWGKKTR